MNSCREWQGARTTKGYGQRKVPGTRRNVLLHRWVWEQVNGPIPEGMVVMHTCDNPPCFLYEHLRLGTQAENLADMRAKGRAVYTSHGNPGERNGMTTLTQQQVNEIRAAIAAGEVQARIAERYSVDRATITNIKKGKTWA